MRQSGAAHFFYRLFACDIMCCGAFYIHNVMKHMIFTRIRFDDDDRFEYYLDLMKRWYVPSVESQLDQDFRLGFIVRDRHRGVVGSLFGGRAYFFGSEGEAGSFAISEGINIQTRHDCDDWMHEGYTRRVKEVYRENESRGSFLVSSVLYKFDVSSGILYSCGSISGGDGFIGPFLSLCQVEVKHYVRERNHRRMGFIGEVFCIRGYTMQVMHGGNSLAVVWDLAVPCAGSFPDPHKI